MDTFRSKDQDLALRKKPVSNLRRKKIRQASLVFGLFLLLVGIIVFSVFPAILQIFLKKHLAIRKESDFFEKWRQTPLPITFKVYLFNVTNPNAVLMGEKPIVKEVGPYTFRQWRKKDVLSWNSHSATVTYNDFRRYDFLENESCNLSSKIYSLNVPMQAILMILKKVPSYLRSTIAQIIDDIFESYGEQIFSHKTVRELLFEGYKVDLIEDIVDSLSLFVTVPKLLPNNTFGFLYGKNNSGNGIFEIYTGANNLEKHSTIMQWNNKSKTDFWNNEYCNMINGTSGLQFPPPVTRGDTLYVFVVDTCRSIEFQYKKDVTVEGIPALRFQINERVLDSPLVNPDNVCFYHPEDFELSGMMDISNCRKGLKLFLTLPHFYFTPDLIRQSVSGLNPNKEKHESYLDIEPTTGIVIRAARRLQFNFMLEFVDGITDMERIKKYYLPLIWVSEEASIDGKGANFFNNKVRTPMTIAKSLLIACIILGAILTITFGFCMVFEKNKQKTNDDFKYKFEIVPDKSAELTENGKTVNMCSL